MAPHVDLDVLVEAGDDEEHPGPAGAAGQEAAQAEYHCSLVLLQEMSGTSHNSIHIASLINPLSNGRSKSGLY